MGLGSCDGDPRASFRWRDEGKTASALSQKLRYRSQVNEKIFGDSQCQEGAGLAPACRGTPVLGKDGVNVSQFIDAVAVP